MRVLVIGSGGREHALAWKLRQSQLVGSLYITPGNGGTAREGLNFPLSDSDLPGLLNFIQEKKVQLVLVGPEAPLVAGLSDALAKTDVICFGPSAYCAQLEGSKAFAKNLMREAGVPTADFAVFDDYDLACDYLDSLPEGPLVVKADGLAAGKGVVVAKSREEAKASLSMMMRHKIFGQAGERVLIEEALCGEEASFLALCDGENFVTLPACQDHKAVGEADTGPNTGGMGAYCPAPILPDSRAQEMGELVIRPILENLAAKGHPFKGVLYAGLMLTARGPYVLEYNVRFGDPECQPLLLRLKSDLAELAVACATGKLRPSLVEFRQQSALCVVMAAKGYPGKYPKDMAISGFEAAEALPGVKVFQAGTRMSGPRTVSSGGRVLGVTALGDDLAQAKAQAYKAVELINYENAYYRRDIGDKGLAREIA